MSDHMALSGTWIVTFEIFEYILTNITVCIPNVEAPTVVTALGAQKKPA